jgi:tRNA A37 N6-isopentenylltransferase MiaA
VVSYAERLGEVLRRRDPRALQRFLAENARRFGDARQVAEIEGKSAEEMHELMQRMIQARADLQRG